MLDEWRHFHRNVWALLGKKAVWVIHLWTAGESTKEEAPEYVPWHAVGLLFLNLPESSLFEGGFSGIRDEHTCVYKAFIKKSSAKRLVIKAEKVLELWDNHSAISNKQWCCGQMYYSKSPCSSIIQSPRQWLKYQALFASEIRLRANKRTVHNIGLSITLRISKVTEKAGILINFNQTLQIYLGQVPKDSRKNSY